MEMKKMKTDNKTKKNVVMNQPETKIDIFSKEVITELNKRVKTIRTEMGKVENSFSKIAFNLYWIYNTQTFQSVGYDDIYTFAKDEFGIARGTTNNFLNVVKRFGKRVGNDILPEISDEYKDYKSSQLIAMLGMDEQGLGKVTKEMSVREIKKLKKEITTDESFEKEMQRDTVEKKSEKEPVDVKAICTNRTVMLTLKDLDDYLKHRDTIETMISRTFSAKGKDYKVEISCTW